MWTFGTAKQLGEVAAEGERRMSDGRVYIRPWDYIRHQAPRREEGFMKAVAVGQGRAREESC